MNSINQRSEKFQAELSAEINEALNWDQIEKYVPRGGSVAELYSGYAIPTLNGFSRLVGESGTVLGVDVEDFGGNLLASNVHRLIAEVPFLPTIEDNRLDVVFVSRFKWAYAVGMRNDPERDDFASEILRILKTGGHFIIKERIGERYADDKGKTDSQLISELFGDALEEVAAFEFGSDSQVFVYKKR